MNILARHIKSLLLTHDHVALPQFGTFFTDAEPCCREGDDVFMPMRRVLRFTPDIDDADTLLVGSLASAYNLSDEQAHERLDSEIALAGQTLASTGSLDFDTLGTFNLVGGRIVFETCKATLTVPRMYGLDALSMPLLPTLTASAPEEKEPERHKNYVIRINRELVHYAACIAATIVLFFTFGTPVGNQRPAAPSQPDLTGIFIPHINRLDLDALTSATYIEEPAVETHDAAPTPEADAREQADAPVETADTANDAKPAQKKQPAAITPNSEPQAPSHFFCVCLASDVTRSGAETYVGQLHKAGYDKARVMVKGRKTRVVYGAFATRQEAVQAKASLQAADKQFETAWILETK